MTLLSVIGIILIAVGILALLSVISIGLPIAIILIVVGLVFLILDNRAFFVRRGP